MKDNFTAGEEVVLLENRGVPEPVESDPFEDDETGEIVLLDVMRIDMADIELL